LEDFLSINDQKEKKKMGKNGVDFTKTL